MVDLKKLQKDIIRNKVRKGFDTTNIAFDFCRAHEELSESFKKHTRGEDGVAEELADVAIFLLGICETFGFDLEKEIVRKVEINKNRVYKKKKLSNGEKVLLRVRTQEDP